MMNHFVGVRLRTKTYSTMRHIVILLILSVAARETLGQESQSTKSGDKVISIIGNSELPRAELVLPWALPSLQTRSEKSQELDLPDVLSPITPLRHKQLVYFKQHLTPKLRFKK